MFQSWVSGADTLKGKIISFISLLNFDDFLHVYSLVSGNLHEICTSIIKLIDCFCFAHNKNAFCY